MQPSAVFRVLWVDGFVGRLEIGVFHKRNARTLVVVLISAAIAAVGFGSAAAQSLSPSQQLVGGSINQPPDTAAPPAGAPEATVVPPNEADGIEAPDFPRAVTEFDHGGTYWGVYITVVRTGQMNEVSPEDQMRLDAARNTLMDVGYQPDSGYLDCEPGVVEQLRLDPQREYAATRIFFAEEAQARQFVEAYEPGVVGTAKVTMGCLD